MVGKTFRNWKRPTIPYCVNVATTTHTIVRGRGREEGSLPVVSPDRVRLLPCHPAPRSANFLTLPSRVSHTALADEGGVAIVVCTVVVGGRVLEPCQLGIIPGPERNRDREH